MQLLSVVFVILMLVILMLSSPGDINLKNLAFTPYCGIGVWRVQYQDVITIQTSTMTPLSATVSCKCVGVGGWGWECIHSYNACWYMRSLNNNGNERKNSEKVSVSQIDASNDRQCRS